MLRRDRQIRTQIHQLVDACLFALSFWLAYALRLDPQLVAWLHLPAISNEALDTQKLVWLYAVLIPAGPLILESQNFYNRPAFCPRRAVLWPLFKGCVITTIGLVLAMWAFRFVTPRGMMIFFAVISFSLVYVKEEVVRLALRSRMIQSQSRRRFVLVGTSREIARMRAELKQHTDASVEVMAEFDLIEKPVQQIVNLLHDHSVFGVILSAKHTNFEQVEYVIRACELEGIEVWLIADFFSTQISRTSFDELIGRPLLIFRTTPEASWQSAAKQILDLLGAFLLLVSLIVIPVIPLIALAIKFTSPGPVFFRQKRSGLNGTPFTIYKFRTMGSNAEQFKHELEAMNEMSGPVFKVTNDPRVTSIGKFLRKYSLDELPQLFNVLRGEMSLVGPRPLPVDEVRRFDNLAHRRRLSVKPGLTCLWQISGRNQISDFKEWVRLDLEYIDNWTIWLDLKILLLTIPAVLRGTGAK
ncbi:MAG TPA: sugar transferase [Verrucomicrobiae bacterium]|jgi:exopolysaccharide biosynthesis polyprenyl glycosylphosphotransferase|nr:sugar transferase [Verrucomicrobiae bacterium]